MGNVSINVLFFAVPCLSTALTDLFLLFQLRPSSTGVVHLSEIGMSPLENLICEFAWDSFFPGCTEESAYSLLTPCLSAAVTG